MPMDGFKSDYVTSEVDCHREEVLDLDLIFRSDSDIPEEDPRGGWMCTISLFVNEDNYALGEMVEAEIAFASYQIGDDDVCELVDLEVAVPYRGHGLGHRLVDEVLADIRLKGGTRLYLFAYEPEEGSRVEFFQRHGFIALELPEGELGATSLPHPMRLDLEPEGN
jgi:GNAT superfamily N-acetyltransferase